MNFATWNEAVNAARDRADRTRQWPHSPKGELHVHVGLQYTPKIMHVQEVAQEVLGPQEHASYRKK